MLATPNPNPPGSGPVRVRASLRALLSGTRKDVVIQYLEFGLELANVRTVKIISTVGMEEVKLAGLPCSP